MSKDALAKNRMECKFHLADVDIHTIRTVLRTNCKPIIHQNKVNIVQTLYFDDELFSSYYENQDGISRRCKTRIRWYNNSTWDNVFLEFKYRNNMLSSKDRILLNLTNPITEMTYKEIEQELKKQLSRDVYEQFASKSKPVLINRYKREYFFDPHTKTRLTLDYDIQCFNQTTAKKPNFKFSRKLDNVVILECKIPVNLVHTMREALDPLRIRVSKSSKYIQCLELLAS